MLICQYWNEKQGYKKLRIKSQEDIRLWTVVEVDMYPDLDDWGTCGILLGKLSEAVGDSSFDFEFNNRHFGPGSWILKGDSQEPFEVWDSFGGIVAASLLFVWDEKEPDLWS
jgi:hypothetical protein